MKHTIHRLLILVFLAVLSPIATAQDTDGIIRAAGSESEPVPPELLPPPAPAAEPPASTVPPPPVLPPPSSASSAPKSSAIVVPLLPQPGTVLRDPAPATTTDDAGRLRLETDPSLSGLPVPGTIVLEQDATPIPSSLVFRTRDILRPELLKGKNYRLVEYAPLINYRFRFEIETCWGTIPAHGMAMLELRLREIQAIERAARIGKKNPMFVEGIVQAALNTPEGAYILATDPIDSMRRAACGMKRVIKTGFHSSERRRDCAARRKLACIICCDPESRNPILQCMLDDMSMNATAGWLAAQIGLNWATPGLGVLPFNAQVAQMAPSPQETDSSLLAQLKELGIAEASALRFLGSSSYTTTQRLAFVFYLHRLIGIENLTSLVDGAVDTVSESEALASIQELQLLVELRRTHSISRVSFIGLPMILLDDGKQMIVTSADYIVDTPRILQMIAQYRNDYPATPTSFMTAGRVSSGAQRQFNAAGIEVAHVRLDGTAIDAAAKLQPPTTTASSAAASQSAKPQPQ